MAADLKEQYDKIYQYCYFKVHHRELAEDLTQETFLHFFSQNSYINHGKPLAYLYTIARNLCTDHFRREAGKKYVPEDETKSLLAESDPGIEGMAERIAVTQAVKKLPRELQELILLRYTQELPVSMTADILGVSRFCVYRKEKEAMRLLKSLLEP